MRRPKGASKFLCAIYVGGLIRARVERERNGKAALGSDLGILAASGVVAGEGLAGALVAGLVGLGVVPKSKDPLLHGGVGVIPVLGIVVAIAVFLRAAGRSARTVDRR